MIVMEYCDKGDLSQLFESSEQLNWETRMKIIVLDFLVVFIFFKTNSKKSVLVNFLRLLRKNLFRLSF